MTVHSNKSRPRVRPPRSSWSTRKRLRYPEKYDHSAICGRFQQLARSYSKLLDFEERERVYLPDDLHFALLTLLEKVVIPCARYDQWCAYGVDTSSSHLVWSTLSDCSVYDDRFEQVAKALMAIEPFPSKKEVDRFKIEKVLAEAGDIWSACRKAEHRLATH